MCTAGKYTRGSYGSHEVLAGEVTPVVAGHGARGDAGRIGGWTEALVIMSPGAVVLVRPEGGRTSRAFYVVHNGNTVVAMSQDDFASYNPEGAGVKEVLL